MTNSKRAKTITIEDKDVIKSIVIRTPGVSFSDRILVQPPTKET